MIYEKIKENKDRKKINNVVLKNVMLCMKRLMSLNRP